MGKSIAVTKIAVTREVGQGLGGCALTFVERQAIDLAKAAAQHRAYCEALRAAGLAVQVLPADETLADAVFVEDTAVVLDELAIISRPGAPSRRAEVASVATVLAQFRTIVSIEAPGTLDGGDVLQIGRRIFVGLSSRSNSAAFAQLAAMVQPLGYEPIPVEVSGCLHLKTAVTALDPGTVLLNPGWIDPAPFAPYRCLVVPETEPFGANTLNLDGVVHLSASAPQTCDLLHNNGFATRALVISELEKAEAGLTCLSLIFQTAASSCSGPSGTSELLRLAAR